MPCAWTSFIEVNYWGFSGFTEHFGELSRPIQAQYKITIASLSSRYGAAGANAFLLLWDPKRQADFECDPHLIQSSAQAKPKGYSLTSASSSS